MKNDKVVKEVKRLVDELDNPPSTVRDRARFAEDEARAEGTLPPSTEETE